MSMVNKNLERVILLNTKDFGGFNWAEFFGGLSKKTYNKWNCNIAYHIEKISKISQ